MTKYRIQGIEGPRFIITVEAKNKKEAQEKAEKVYENHFEAWPNEKIDEAWENGEQQDHLFDEVEVVK